MLIVVSSPSGGGKSTIIRALLKKDSTLEYSVSVTSRAPRPGEIDGESYTFVSDEQFKKWIDEGRFYEWAVVHNYLYGTRKDVITEKLTRGKDVIMDIDFQGGLNVKKQSPDAVLIFLLPPSIAILASEEIRYATQYDFVVINDDLDRTIETVRAIMSTERLRTKRLKIVMENE